MIHPMFKPTDYTAGFLPAGGWDVDMNEKYPCFLLHWHKELEILKLSGGQGEFMLDSHKYSVGDGDIVIISPQMLHYGIVTSKEPLKCRMLCMNPEIVGCSDDEIIYKEYVAPFENERLAFTPLIHSREYPDIACQIDTVVKLFETRADAAVLIKAELIKLYALLIDNGVFFRKENRIRKRAEDMKEIIRYIENHLSDKITVDELAGLAGYSKFHFIRKFKERTGATVTGYINSLRLAEASDLLITTKLPVNIIGEKAGIPNTPYFIKIFKSEFSMTPQAYRKFYSP